MHVAVKEEFLPFYPSPVGLSFFFFWQGSKSPLQTKVPGRLMVSGCGSKPQETVGVSGLIKKKNIYSTKKDLHRQNSRVSLRTSGLFALKRKLLGWIRCFQEEDCFGCRSLAAVTRCVLFCFSSQAGNATCPQILGLSSCIGKIPEQHCAARVLSLRVIMHRYVVRG